MPNKLPSERLRDLRVAVSNIEMAPEDSAITRAELEEIAQQVEYRDSPVRLEQYKTLEARIDRLGTTQFGLWPVGVVGLLGTIALTKDVGTPAIAWTICLVASILTIIGWQCSIAADNIGSHLIDFHAGYERPVTVILEETDLKRNLGELVVWPLVLCSGMLASLFLGRAQKQLTSDVVLGLGVGLSLLTSAALWVQAYRVEKKRSALRTLSRRPTLADVEGQARTSAKQATKPR